MWHNYWIWLDKKSIDHVRFHCKNFIYNSNVDMRSLHDFPRQFISKRKRKKNAMNFTRKFVCNSFIRNNKIFEVEFGSWVAIKRCCKLLNKKKIRLMTQTTTKYNHMSSIERRESNKKYINWKLLLNDVYETEPKRIVIQFKADIFGLLRHFAILYLPIANEKRNWNAFLQ